MTDNKGYLPLHRACLKGCVEVTRLLLHNFPDTVNRTTPEEDRCQTPLHLAAESGSVDCIELLLQLEANIEAATSDDRTALQAAADNEQWFAVDYLLGKGAQGTVINEHDWPPLHDACLDGYVEMVRFLLEQRPDNANFTTTNRHDSWTSLHAAAQCGSVDCIRLLLQHGANVEATTNNGKTPLHVAAEDGHLLAVKYLLEKGARGIATENRGRLPLHRACLNGYVDVVRFLLEMFPNTINATTTEAHGRWTPLHMAAQSGNVDCIQMLLKHGAAINKGTTHN